MSRNMVLIHGAWLASNSWEHFAGYFTDRGYDVIAPEWPRKHDDVADQRADPEELAGLGVKEIVDHYDAIVRAMSEPPVLVGHSFGGLFVEMLLDRGLGAAGVALDPAAPKGVLRVEPSQLKAAGPALNHPLHRHGVVPLDFEEFRYAFVNTWDEEAARDAYDRYAVPETARILFQGGLANFALHPATRIDFHKADRAPLLITAGEKDNTVPPASRRPPSTSTSTPARRPTSSSSRVARTCSSPARAGRRSPATSPAGSTGCSPRRRRCRRWSEDHQRRR
jgi:pimeloyl-ACP methyl ester carboxylesterase